MTSAPVLMISFYSHLCTEHLVHHTIQSYVLPVSYHLPERLCCQDVSSFWH